MRIIPDGITLTVDNREDALGFLAQLDAQSTDITDAEWDAIYDGYYTDRHYPFHQHLRELIELKRAMK